MAGITIGAKFASHDDKKLYEITSHDVASHDVGVKVTVNVDDENYHQNQVWKLEAFHSPDFGKRYYWLGLRPDRIYLFDFVAGSKDYYLVIGADDDAEAVSLADKVMKERGVFYFPRVADISESISLDAIRKGLIDIQTTDV